MRKGGRPKTNQFTAGKLHHLSMETGVTVGTLRKSLLNQEEPFTRWLMNQTVEGTDIADTLVAIAIDVYYEEFDSIHERKRA